mmetsp:Transcript_21443/g.38054  ORF Transcript_21443/g.38054 Transcript_21443/m.38054 type:complete len:83 (-) Transcript_21443:672-920(-)
MSAFNAKQTGQRFKNKSTTTRALRKAPHHSRLRKRESNRDSNGDEERKNQAELIQTPSWRAFVTRISSSGAMIIKIAKKPKE